VSPYYLLPQHSTAAEQLECARGWSERLAAGCGAMVPHRRAATRRRIRLGYLSADFRDHPVAYASAGLIETHDRASFEVHAYAYGPDAGGAMRARIAAGCDRFNDVRDLSDAQAAQRIHDDGIDILIDLTGHTRHARTRILAFRPAPVQVHFLGYVASMGATFIDAIIVDEFVVPPDQQRFYTERLAPVAGCWWPATIDHAVGERTLSRQDCGLPAEGFVFCCFNSPHKITPEIFDIWMRLLAAVPGSVLWLSEPNRLVAANLRREAERRGVAPERVVFSGLARVTGDYLPRLRVADLFLDTLPYNACTTAYDALSQGLPLLTCAGATFAGRMAGTLLHRLGLPELITASLADYEHRALQLAREPAMLGGLRERLARERSTAALFDIRRGTRDLEAVFISLWEAWLAKERAPAADR
jgi:protein O-GlcNAc transferase